MKLGNLQGIIPTRRTCFDLLCLLETEYACTITFWIKPSQPPGAELVWTLFANGSGDIWDASYMAGFTATARISEMHAGSLYPAIWAALLQLESRFKEANRMAVTARPI